MDSGKLIKAFTRYGSDKSTHHHYEVGYSQILPDKVNNLLEIGIANYTADKSSVHAWHDIYPDAQIYAMDIVPEKMINNEFTKSFVVDQSSSEQLENFRDSVGVKFDVIIDDGSHLFWHASLTYEILRDCLADGGIYIIEDIQKIREFNYQDISEWVYYLESRSIEYKIIDCKPYKSNNVLMIYMYK
jgi:hypothetical protein